MKDMAMYAELIQKKKSLQLLATTIQYSYSTLGTALQRKLLNTGNDN